MVIMGEIGVRAGKIKEVYRFAESAKIFGMASFNGCENKSSPLLFFPISVELVHGSENE